MGNSQSKIKRTFDTGVVYKIYNDDWCYIGSTVNFKTRQYGHKSMCCNKNLRSYNYKVYKTIRENGGWGAFKMVVIHTVTEWVTDVELKKKEQFYINLLNPNLNDCKAYLTQAERLDSMKQYQKNHKDNIRENKKQYNIENKEENAEYKKNYYIDNSVRLKEKANQYYKDNKDNVKEKANQYYKDNRDKINEQRKLAYLKKKLLAY